MGTAKCQQQQVAVHVNQQQLHILRTMMLLHMCHYCSDGELVNEWIGVIYKNQFYNIRNTSFDTKSNFFIAFLLASVILNMSDAIFFPKIAVFFKLTFSDIECGRLKYMECHA